MGGEDLCWNSDSITQTQIHKWQVDSRNIHQPRQVTRSTNK